MVNGGGGGGGSDGSGRWVEDEEALLVGELNGSGGGISNNEAPACILMWM